MLQSNAHSLESHGQVLPYQPIVDQYALNILCMHVVFCLEHLVHACGLHATCMHKACSNLMLQSNAHSLESHGQVLLYQPIVDQ